jgi:hypothetical protein
MPPREKGGADTRKRTRALAMVRTLDSEAVRGGGGLIMWCPIDMLVKRPADIDVLAFAAARDWKEAANGGDRIVRGHVHGSGATTAEA